MGLWAKWLIVWVLACTMVAAPVRAEPTIGVERVATRAGVRVPLFTVWQPGAVATVVLYSGGGGGYGQLGSDGWPSGNNFLIRTGKFWAAHPFNLVMVGRASDGIDLEDGAVRTGAAHAADNRAIFKALKARSPVPLWVIGTSMGTISATAAAIQDTEGLVAGVVLTASITAARIPGAVPTQELARVRVPTLVVHHFRDACRVCVPQDASRIVEGLSEAPRKEFMFIETGGTPSGQYCKAMHYHGFIGAEQETVDRIARWMQQSLR